MRPAATLAVVFALSCLTAAAARQQDAPQQRPPLLRSRITIVPLDVRVIGADGRPVTGLTQDDFTVLEDGVPQSIRFFSAHTFTPDPSLAAAPPELRRASEVSADGANRRVFLLMAGRGRHQVVSKYVDGLGEFVSTLLPQDQVAFMAWNRATDFTANHAQIREVLAQYRDRHEKIERDLREWFSGLRAVYGSKEIPEHIQRQIDLVFAAVPSLRPRSIASSPDADPRRAAARTAADELQRAEILKERPAGASLPDTRAEILANLGGMAFEEYIAKSSETFQDLGAMYSAIEYLRYLEGEKHVVLLSERGMYMPLLSGNNHLASVASDARIALNIVQTGGVVGPPPPNMYRTVAVPSFAAVSGQTFSIQDLRMLAEDTGGQLSAFKHADQSFARLTNVLGFQYVLAYVPSKDAGDGRFRRIEVKVRRPGVTVQHRRGYFATPEIVPLDRRAFVTFSRIRAALRYTRPIGDIGVKVTGAAVAKDSLTIELRIDLARLSFEAKDGSHTAAIDVGVFATNHDRAQVGEVVRRVDLTFPADLYQRALKDGAVISVRIPLTGAAAHVKAVVYDYKADLIGTVQGDLR